MKHLKDHKIEYIRKEETHRTCDKCGSTIKMESSFDCFNSSFRLTEGDAYPDGNFTDIKRADFCQDCAEWVMKLLNENGVQFYEYDGDQTQTFRKTQL